MAATSNRSAWEQGSALLILAGALALGGCDPTADLRKPELPSCQRFLRSRMRVPTSFHRNWYNVSDFPVTRDQLAKAIGDAGRAAQAADPAIRRVMVQYAGSDGFGTEVTGFGVCYFPMTDGAGGGYAHDVDDAVDRAIHENEQRTLALSTGSEGIVAADCCTAPGFDAKILDRLIPHRRGMVKADGRKL